MSAERMSELFPEARSPRPPLAAARERLHEAELRWDRAWTAMEDYGDPPPDKATHDELHAARAAVARLEREELERQRRTGR